MYRPGECDYNVFVSTEGVACFCCANLTHLVNQCPKKKQTAHSNGDPVLGNVGVSENKIQVRVLAETSSQLAPDVASGD